MAASRNGAGVLERFERLHRGASDVHRIVTAMRLGQHVTHPGGFEHSTHRTTGDHASTWGRRLQKDRGRTIALGDLVRNGRAIQRNGDHRFLGLLDAFANRIGHFTGLAHADADRSLAVTNDNQAAERKTTTTLDDFGDAIDLYDALFELGAFLLLVVAPS